MNKQQEIKFGRVYKTDDPTYRLEGGYLIPIKRSNTMFEGRIHYITAMRVFDGFHFDLLETTINRLFRIVDEEQ